MRCKATTQSGDRCKNTAQQGSGYCYVESHRSDKKGYDIVKLKEMALSAIQTHNLVFQSDIIAYLPCSESTFYNHKLEEMEDLKKALFENRVGMKVSMRNKWYNSDNASLQIALMKLISDDDERRRMAMEYRDHTSNGEGIFDELKSIIPAPDED